MPDPFDVNNPKLKPLFEKLLRLAASRGDADLVAERLSWGINPNAQSKKGRTALIANAAGHSPNATVVRDLLKAGADPTLMDHRGLTALDYARRKLAKIMSRPRKPPRKSPSLDENDQLILSKEEQEHLDEIRREHPDMAKEFIRGYWKERLRAAKRKFNDPDEVEKIVDLLEAATAGECM